MGPRSGFAIPKTASPRPSNHYVERHYHWEGDALIRGPIKLVTGAPKASSSAPTSPVKSNSNQSQGGGINTSQKPSNSSIIPSNSGNVDNTSNSPASSPQQTVDSGLPNQSPGLGSQNNGTSSSTTSAAPAATPSNPGSTSYSNAPSSMQDPESHASSSHTLSKALGGTFGALAVLSLLGLLIFFCIRRKRKQNRESARESFAAVGTRRNTTKSTIHVGSLSAAFYPADDPMHPEDPADLRYSATGSGLLHRLRGTTAALTANVGGAAAATRASLGLAIGNRHDGTDPFSETEVTKAPAHYGDYTSPEMSEIGHGHPEMVGIARGGASPTPSEEMSYPLEHHMDHSYPVENHTDHSYPVENHMDHTYPAVNHMDHSYPAEHHMDPNYPVENQPEHTHPSENHTDHSYPFENQMEHSPVHHMDHSPVESRAESSPDSGREEAVRFGSSDENHFMNRGKSPVSASSHAESHLQKLSTGVGAPWWGGGGNN